jgi:WD40 repeat protein
MPLSSTPTAPWHGLGPRAGRRLFFPAFGAAPGEADRPDEVKALLCNYNWLAAKLRATNVPAVLTDYDLLVQDPDLGLIEQALRLSIPALLRDWSQLPGQLLGRLLAVDRPTVKALVAEAGYGPSLASLSPRFASLTAPGGPVGRILMGHRGPVYSVVALPDQRRALSASGDKTLRLWDLATGDTLRRTHRLG